MADAPVVGPQRPVVAQDELGRGQQQRHSQLGHRRGVVVQVVDGDAREVVHQVAGFIGQPGPRDDDRAQVGRGGQLGTGGAAGDEDVGVGGRVAAFGYLDIRPKGGSQMLSLVGGQRAVEVDVERGHDADYAKYGALGEERRGRPSNDYAIELNQRSICRGRRKRSTRRWAYSGSASAAGYSWRRRL